jgi:hypothetical protein
MGKEWSQGESNPRPLECHSSALPTELWPHFARYWVARALRGPRPGREPSTFFDGQLEAPGTSTASRLDCFLLPALEIRGAGTNRRQRNT